MTPTRSFALRIALLLVLAFPGIARAQSPWTAKANLGIAPAFPQTREYPLSFSIGSKGYAGFGINAQYMSDFWEYDTLTNLWTQKADFPTLRTNFFGSAFSAGGYGYIGFPDLWRYDPAANAWTRKAAFPGANPYSCPSVGIGGKGYVLTSSDTANWWEYDPGTDAWTRKSDYPLSRYGAKLCAIGNRGYAAMGIGAHPHDCYSYDPATDAWTRKADFPGRGRAEGIGFAIGGQGYFGFGDTSVTTGGTNLEFFSDLWRYDTLSDSWSAAPAFPGDPMHSPVYFAVGTKAFLGMGSAHHPIYGGTSTYLLESFWSFDATNGAWTYKGKFEPGPRVRPYAFSIGSFGYIAGGAYREERPDSARNNHQLWRYDRSSDSWSQRADLPGPDSAGAFSFALSGSGYIGTESGGVYAYDPAANLWTQKASYPGEGRTGCVAFALGSKGYAGTGRTRNGAPRSDFWSYDPAADQWTRLADFGGGARGFAIGLPVSGRGCVGTGVNSAGKVCKDLWSFDPALNSWQREPDLPGAGLNYGTGFAIGGSGFFGFGLDSTGNFNPKLWEYQPASRRWIDRTDTGFNPVYGAGAFSIGSRGYVALGYASRSRPGLHNFYEYTPLTTGVPEAAAQTSGVRVYPNPARGSVTVLPAGEYTLRLRTLDGKLLLERARSGSLDLHSLPPAAYLLDISDGSGRTLRTERIILE